MIGKVAGVIFVVERRGESSSEVAPTGGTNNLMRGAMSQIVVSIVTDVSADTSPARSAKFRLRHGKHHWLHT